MRPRARVAGAGDDVDRAPPPAHRPAQQARAVLGLVDDPRDGDPRHSTWPRAGARRRASSAGEHAERAQHRDLRREGPPAGLLLQDHVFQARAAEPLGDPLGRLALAWGAGRAVDPRQVLDHLAQRALVGGRAGWAVFETSGTSGTSGTATGYAPVRPTRAARR